MLWSFGQVHPTMLCQGMRTRSIFKSQHVATRRNRVAKRVQHVAPNNVEKCCVEMLRSFDWSLQMLGQSINTILLNALSKEACCPSCGKQSNQSEVKLNQCASKRMFLCRQAGVEIN